MDLQIGIGGRNIGALLRRPAITDRSRADDDYIGRLHCALGITASQKGPWAEFADALRANAARLYDVPPPSEGHRHLSAQEAPDAVDQVFGTLPQRLSALSAMRAAAARLYTVLTPQQKHMADQLLPLCCLIGTAAMSGTN